MYVWPASIKRDMGQAGVTVASVRLCDGDRHACPGRDGECKLEFIKGDFGKHIDIDR